MSKRLGDLIQRSSRLAALPPRLRAFHERVRQLQRGLEELAQRLTWLVRGRDLHALETRMAQLEDLGRHLTKLIDEAERLGGRTKSLEEHAALLRDASVGAWFHTRARAAAEVLAGLGAAAATAEAVVAERRRLELAQNELLLLERALDLYREAEDWLQRVQAEGRKAALNADLPDLGRRLATEGASDDWNQTLDTLLEPLREFANRSQPPGLGELGARIQGLREWAAVLGEPCPECDALAQDYIEKKRDWAVQDEDAFEVLRTRTLELETKLHTVGEGQRRAWLADIETHKALLRELSERDDELEALHDKLLGTIPADAQGFAAWRDDYARARSYFESLAATRSQDLAERHRSLVERCREQLERLSKRPRLDAADRRLRDLSQCLSKLEPIPDADRAMSGIRALRDLAAKADALGHDIEGDLVDLEARRRALDDHRAHLSELARRLGQTLPPELTPTPSAAGDASVPERLEQVRSDTEALERNLEAAWQTLLAAALARITACRARITEIQDLLTTPGAAVPPHEEGPMADPRSVEDLAAAIDSAEARLEQEQNRLAGALDELSQQRETLLGRSAGIDLQRLGPIQAQQVAQRRHLLEQWRPSADADLLVQVRSLSDLVLAMRRVLHPVEQARQRAQSLRRNLGERLRRVTLCMPNPSFPEACQEWAQRIEGLIAPDCVCRPVQAENAQLDEAKRLLDALEGHCRRLQAIQDITDVAKLRELGPQTGDPRVEALSRHIAALPYYEALSERVRLELQDLIAAHAETCDHGL